MQIILKFKWTGASDFDVSAVIRQKIGSVKFYTSIRNKVDLFIPHSNVFFYIIAKSYPSVPINPIDPCTVCDTFWGSRGDS